MGGFVLENEGTPVHAVIPGQYDMKFTDFEFPHITEKQIQDRSKGDALSKAIVLGQLGWFLIQCITRGAERLPVTELELVTAAYAVLTTFIYIAWWSKPKDISCYTPVSRSNTGKDKIFSGWGFHTFLENFLSILLCHPNLERSPKVPSLFSGSDDMGSRGPPHRSRLSMCRWRYFRSYPLHSLEFYVQSSGEDFVADLVCCGSRISRISTYLPPYWRYFRWGLQPGRLPRISQYSSNPDSVSWSTFVCSLSDHSSRVASGSSSAPS